MFGLFYLFLISVYVWLNLGIFFYFRKTLPKRYSYAIALILIALPFADAYIGRVSLQTMCEEGNRIHVVKSVSNIDGIFVGEGMRSPTDYGYNYVEYGYYGEWVTRAIESGDPNSPIIEEKQMPKAIYEFAKVGLQKNFWLNKYHYVARIKPVDKGIESTEILGSFYWYTFRGGWAERIFTGSAGPIGHVAECGDYNFELNKVRELLHATLQPAKIVLYN